MLTVQSQSATLALPTSSVQYGSVQAVATVSPTRESREIALERQLGSTWKPIDWVEQAADGTAAFWIDTDLIGQQTYRVVAEQHWGAPAVASAPATITITAVQDPPDTTAPGPVTDLEATDVTETSLWLWWSLPYDADYSGAMIRRSVGTTPPASPTSGTLVADVPGLGSPHLDSALAPGTTYSYAVFAHDEVPNYAPAATLTVETLEGVDTTPPGPVTGLTVGSATASTLTLAWTNPGAADYAGATIRRAVGTTPPATPTSGTLVTDAAAPGTSHVDTGLTPGTTYSYAVFAHDEVPNYAPAATATGITTGTPDTTPPGPVTGLTVGAATVSTLTLTWTNPGAPDYAGAMIRRAVGTTPPASQTAGTLVTDKAAPGTSHVDTGLTPGTTYSYAVFAHDAVPNYAGAATGTGTTTAPGTGDWAQTGHDPGRTGWVPDESTITTANVDALAQEWSTLGQAYPAVYDGVLYTSSTSQLAGEGRLTAYDLTTSIQLWQVPTGTCTGPLSVDATRIVVGCGEPRAYARTGSHDLLWDVHDTDPGASMQYFQLTADRLVTWMSDRVAAYRLSDGQRVWQQLLPSGAGSILDVVVSGTTVVVAYDDRLRALNLANGTQVWSSAGVVSPSLVAAGGWVYTNAGNGVRRYAVADGAAGWAVRDNSDIYRVVGADGDTVYVWEAFFDFGPPSPSILHALSTSDGSERWQASVPSRVGSVAIAGDLVWVTSTDIYSQGRSSDLIALSRATGDQLRSLHFEDNMYGWTSVAFGGGKVVLDQGGSFGDPVPRRLRVFGVAGVVPEVTSRVLPLADAGAGYSTTLTSTPSGATWTLRSGTLPAGLSLSPSGAIGGTPSAVGLTRFTVRATSANGRYAERTVALEVMGAPGDTWGQAGRDATRNPFLAGSADFGLDAAPTFGFRWKTAAPGTGITGGNSDSVYADHRVYAVQWDGTLSAWSTTGSTANRTPLWSVTPSGGGSFWGQPVLAGDRLIVRDGDRRLHGIRLSDGADLWTSSDAVTHDGGYNSMLVSGTTVITTVGNSEYAAFSTLDGTRKWGGATTGVRDTYRTASTDGTLIFVQAECELYAFRVSDGTTAWHTPIVLGQTDCGMIWSDNGPPVVVDGKVYAATSGGRLVADAATGQALLRFGYAGYQSGDSVVAGGVWIFDNDDRTVAVDTVTGEVLWSVRDNGDLIRYSVVGDLVIALSPYTMVGLSRIDGSTVWDAGNVGGQTMLSSPVLGDRRVLVLTEQGVRAFGALLD